MVFRRRTGIPFNDWYYEVIVFPDKCSNELVFQMQERAIFFLIHILMTCVCSCKGDLMENNVPVKMISIRIGIPDKDWYSR